MHPILVMKTIERTSLSRLAEIIEWDAKGYQKRYQIKNVSNKTSQR